MKATASVWSSRKDGDLAWLAKVNDRYMVAPTVRAVRHSQPLRRQGHNPAARIHLSFVQTRSEANWPHLYKHVSTRRRHTYKNKDRFRPPLNSDRPPRVVSNVIEKQAREPPPIRIAVAKPLAGGCHSQLGFAYYLNWYPGSVSRPGRSRKVAHQQWSGIQINLFARARLHHSWPVPSPLLSPNILEFVLKMLPRAFVSNI